MSSTIDLSFVTAFERDVYHDYQLNGGQLRMAVDARRITEASQATLQRLGTGTATTKGRHGDVPFMDLAHSTRTITLEDKYAAELIDDLDELKNNIDTRGAYKYAISQALGRAEDTLITDTFDACITASGQTLAAGTTLGIAELEEVDVALGELNIPRANRIGIVSWEFASQMRSLPEVANADYVDVNQFTSGVEMFKWNGHMWVIYNGNPIDGSNIRSNYIVDKRNFQFRALKDISIQVERRADKDAWQIMGKYSFGCQFVQNAGAYEITLDES